MWIIQFNVLRDGERSPEDGSPREFLGQDSPFPLPDIDQTVLHRGEAFVVDDVIWDLERKTVTVELVPSDEAEVESGKPAAEAASADDEEGDDDDMSFDEDVAELEAPDASSAVEKESAPDLPTDGRRGPRTGSGKARRGEADG